ncbi:MAG: hypothetical protein ACLFWG_04625 [Longimicrobiales bacterium]
MIDAGLTGFLVVGLSSFLGGVVLGLYVGQRGRNSDLRELARLQLEAEQKPAQVYVRDPASGHLVQVDEPPGDEQMLHDEERERMAKDLMAESPKAITLEEARAEVDRILKKASSMGGGGGG